MESTIFQDLHAFMQSNPRAAITNCLKLVLLILLFSITDISQAQNIKVDSLKSVLEGLEKDASKVNTLNEMADELYRSDPDEALRYGNEAKLLAEKLNYNEGLALAYKNIGSGYYMNGRYVMAFRNWESSLEIYRELEDYQMLVNLLSNMGAVYYSIGKNMYAIEYYMPALEIAKELNDSIGIGTLLLNIGMGYSEQPNTLDKARRYFSRAIELGEDLGDNDIIGVGAINLGKVSFMREEYDLALNYFEESLNHLNNSVDNASVLNLIGTTYSEMKDFPKAYNYQLDAMELARSENAPRVILETVLGLASIFEKLGNPTRAIEYYKEAEVLAEEIGLTYQLSVTYEGLANSYADIEDYPSAYKYLSLQNEIDEVIDKIESEKISSELIDTYQLEKRRNEIAQLENQAEIDALKYKRQRAIIIGAPTGILFLLFTLMLIFRFRYVKKVNIMINGQKEEIEAQRDEIGTQRDEIEAQRDEIEAQRNEVETQRDQLKVQRDLVVRQKDEIIDSITYAKKIQSALMPPEQYFHEILNDVFILFKPRDIVSGDFYWIKQVNQYVILAAADCTGHGVPGAFMSMLGMSYLNEIVHKREITQANQVLNELRKQISNSLRQHGQAEESKDGIDMALCVIDDKNRTIQYSGANNPLFLIRYKNGTPELTEFKADRMPLGYYQGRFKTFTNQDIQLEYGDVFYLFSDGFMDQKGGKDNKKFMSRKFKDLLLSVHQEPMQEQKKVLDKTIIDWMGDNPQIDDILVIGVRV